MLARCSAAPRKLLGLGLLGLSLFGCDASNERLDAERQNMEAPTLDRSPRVESPNASSGITEEALSSMPRDAEAASEQLKKTVNPKADSTWGDWAVNTATIIGESMPRSVADAISLFIDPISYVANIGDQFDKGTVVMRRRPTPMEIDITDAEGPNAGKMILAIFEQPDANTLVVCYNFNDGTRSKAFNSTAENDHFLVKYKRKQLNFQST